MQVKFVLANSPDGGAVAKEGEIGESSSLQAPLVQACILSKIQTAQFQELLDADGARDSGEIRVTYPYTLTQGGGFGGPE